MPKTLKIFAKLVVSTKNIYVTCGAANAFFALSRCNSYFFLLQVAREAKFQGGRKSFGTTLLAQMMQTTLCLKLSVCFANVCFSITDYSAESHHYRLSGVYKTLRARVQRYLLPHGQKHALV